MNRRRFIALSARSAGVLSLFGVTYWPLWSGGRSRTLRDRLCRVFLKLRTTGLVDGQVKALGAAYLEDHPAEATPGRLMAAIINRPAHATGQPGVRYGWSRERIAALIQADYAQHRTVLVDGWVLSRTEAQLCALTFLS